MLLDVLGDIAVGLILVAVTYSLCAGSLTVPPRALRRRWRAAR
jgi:hypothetical protein